MTVSNKSEESSATTGLPVHDCSVVAQENLKEATVSGCSSSTTAAPVAAESATVAKPQLGQYNGLVVDCGTGETKAILCQAQAASDGPIITVHQVSNKLPPVTSFLAQDVKPANGFGFLPENKRPTDEEAVLTPQMFVDYLVYLRDTHKVDELVVGASAWYRASSRNETEVQTNGHDLANALEQQGFRVKILHEKQESYFEAAAISYAFSKVTGKDAVPDGCLSGGSGSSQFAQEGSRFLCIERGNKRCKVQMNELFETYGNFDKAFEALDAFANPSADCEVVRHIHQQRVAEAANLQSATDRERLFQPLSGFIMLISACYYAAVEVGLANRDEEMFSHNGAVVVEKMMAKVEEYKQLLRDYARDPEAHPLPINKRKGKPSRPIDILLPIVNLTLHCTLYTQLFDLKNAQLCFKRDWILPGKQQFRTTWTSGWFLNHIEQKFGTRFPGASKVLDKFHEWEREHTDAALAYRSSPAPAPAL